MNLSQPSFLKSGDTIGITATARKITPEELNNAIQFIQNRGYNVVLSSNIYAQEHQFAGNDDMRRKGLQELLDHPDLKAILIARGGYGTARIIDDLNFEGFKKYPKWICGFSDITVVHSHLFNLGFQSIHSTMPLLFQQSEKATQSLFDTLEGRAIKYEFPHHPLNRLGTVEGIMIGGNLSVLYSLTATPSQMDYRDKILFLEDVDEYLYHIDRMMIHMKRSGFLRYLKGLIIGGMTDMKDNIIPFGKSAEQIIYDAVKEYDYPVCFNFPSGHLVENMAFIHGKRIQLTVSKDFSRVEY